jgi:hypothetical protein
MSIIPARIQEQVNRVDRTRSLWFGISAGLTALWSLYRVFWLLYSATVLSGVGVSSASLIFSAVIWGAVGVAAAVVAVAFLSRYAKQT